MKTLRFLIPILLGAVAFSSAEAEDASGSSEVPTDVPVQVPAEVVSTAPSPKPTFREGDKPVVFQPGEIDQPVFEAPVAPPPISEAGRIEGTWVATGAAAAIALAVAV